MAENGLCIAEVERRGMSNDGVIAFEGQRFTWRRDNVAGTKWRMADTAEHLALQFKSRAMRRQGRVEVRAKGATYPAPVLLPLLGCYLAVIADDDQGGG